MSWALLAAALAFLGYAVLSRRLAASVLTAPIYFLGVGVGFGLLGITDLELGDLPLRRLAEATLTVVLFTDASSIHLRQLRAGWLLPARLLGIGLILTIALGTVVAIPLFPEMLFAEALILAVCLAPTDAALGLPVVIDKRVPGRIRQALNVESGLNDGICVPLLFMAIALALAEGGEATAGGALLTVVEELAAGVLAGLAVGALGAYAARFGKRSGMMDEVWGQVIPLAAAVGAYGLAVPLGGSGFIAAFVGGATYGVLVRRSEAPEPAAIEADTHQSELLEVIGGLLTAATFMIFGAGILLPLLQAIRPEHVTYALLSLTIIRMLPVAIALIGSGAQRPTVAFVGWFGPRGLASIVFAVIVVEEVSGLAGLDDIVITIGITVVLSILAHGLSAYPMVGRYAAWFQRASAVSPDLMEGAATGQMRRRAGMFVSQPPDR